MNRPYCKSCGQSIESITVEGDSMKECYSVAKPCGHVLPLDHPDLAELLKQHMKSMMKSTNDMCIAHGIPPLHPDIEERFND